MSDQNPNRRKIAGERSRRPTEIDPTTGEPAVDPPKRQRRQRRDRYAEALAHPSGEAPSKSRQIDVPNWVLVVLAVLLAAVVTVDVVFAVKDAQEDELAETRSDSLTSAYNTAPAQAEEAATQILGYDYKTLVQDSDEAKAYMTPSYAETFQKTVDGLLTAPAEQVRAHVEANVMASGVASAEANEVEIVLFIDQTSTSLANDRPQTSLNRVVFTMVKSGDRWLVHEITAL